MLMKSWIFSVLDDQLMDNYSSLDTTFFEKREASVVFGSDSWLVAAVISMGCLTLQKKWCLVTLESVFYNGKNQW